MVQRPLSIGITCYPSVGGSGILACALGEILAEHGHHVHFISYERPFRLPEPLPPRVHFHAVEINDYELFRYPDYTLPLSVKMAEVSRDHGLDVLHVHYAVPHATAAILARDMLPEGKRPRIVTTLHGTDTTLLGSDPGYGPAIRHALACSDAITTVSAYLKRETEFLLPTHLPIHVIHNFSPRAAAASARSGQHARNWGSRIRALIVHISNLRPVKRIDLLLETAARIRPRDSFKLLIIAGESFASFRPEARRLGLEDRLIIREKVTDIEDYLNAADLGLFTSESESFCLSILEGMVFGCPSVATRVGGIPELVEDQLTGILVNPGDADQLARAAESLIQNPTLRAAMGKAGKSRAQERFSAETIVPQYESLYRKITS